MKLSATPTTVERLAPALGEHSEAVLREFGLDEREIDDLRATHVI